MKTIVLTSDKGNPWLRGFCHQWKKYAYHTMIQPAIYGFTPPKFSLPYPFFSLGEFADYPADRWSNALIRALDAVKDDFVMILLEDYWLTRKANGRGLSAAMYWMGKHKNAVRFDVTTDRLYCGSIREAGAVEEFDIIQQDGAADYALSFQASIWRRKALLGLLVPNETPWQCELNGSARLNQSGLEVYGTRQWPLRYIVAVNKGQFDPVCNWMVPDRRMAELDLAELDALGYTK